MRLALCFCTTKIRLRLLGRTRPIGSGVAANSLFLVYSSSGIEGIHAHSPRLGIAQHFADGCLHIQGHDPRSALTHDVLWFLVLPKAEETRMSQFVFSRPFGEGDLRHEPWLHPMDTLPRQTVAREGTVRRRYLAKLLAQPA